MFTPYKRAWLEKVDDYYLKAYPVEKHAALLAATGYGTEPGQLEGALKEQVRHAIGAFAAPDIVHIAGGLPKTRSGKIMPRILRKIAASQYDGMGDTSTLADPDVVERLIQEHKCATGGV